MVLRREARLQREKRLARLQRVRLNHRRAKLHRAEVAHLPKAFHRPPWAPHPLIVAVVWASAQGHLRMLPAKDCLQTHLAVQVGPPRMLGDVRAALLARQLAGNGAAHLEVAVHHHKISLEAWADPHQNLVGLGWGDRRHMISLDQAVADRRELATLGVVLLRRSIHGAVEQLQPVRVQPILGPLRQCLRSGCRRQCNALPLQIAGGRLGMVGSHVAAAVPPPWMAATVPPPWMAATVPLPWMADSPLARRPKKRGVVLTRGLVAAAWPCRPWTHQRSRTTTGVSRSP